MSSDKKPREFDLYFSLDEDGSIELDSESICENSEIWKPGCGWAEPNIHVIEYSAYTSALEQIEKLAKALSSVCNESMALASAHDEAISLDYGRTNLECLNHAVSKARQALAELEKWRGEK